MHHLSWWQLYPKKYEPDFFSHFFGTQHFLFASIFLNSKMSWIQNIFIAILDPSWNSTLVEFQLACQLASWATEWYHYSQEPPDRPADHPTTSMFEVLYLSFCWFNWILYPRYFVLVCSHPYFVSVSPPVFCDSLSSPLFCVSPSPPVRILCNPDTNCYSSFGPNIFWRQTFVWTEILSNLIV